MGQCEEKVGEAFKDEEGDGYGLVSLHGCGDLGPSVIRIFAGSSSRSRFLLSAGCCYMKAEELLPLSRHWKGSGEGCRLSYAAR